MTSYRYLGNWSIQKEAAAELTRNSADGPEFFASIRDKVEEMLPPDAEKYVDFEERIIHCLNHSNFNADGEHTLIVAHGSIRQVLTDHLHLSENNAGPKKYGKPVVFESNDDGSWSVHLI